MSLTGFLNHCVENLLLDDHFWLSSLEEAIRINVQLDNECLDMIYKSLLIQEGNEECSYNAPGNTEYPLNSLEIYWHTCGQALSLHHNWDQQQNVYPI